MAWEGKGQTQGTGCGCDSLGRERPEPGVVVRGLPGPAGGCEAGWRAGSRDMLRRGPGRFRHSALIALS